MSLSVTSGDFPFPKEQYYNRYGRYLREIFGGKVLRLSLDAGFSCPTRDGTLGYGGCLYCNNASFAEDRLQSLKSIREQLAAGIESARRGHRSARFLAYFQSYTNTYKNPDELDRLYREVLAFPEVVGICIGTRPDCVNEDIFRLLQKLNREIYVSIEFGVESVYDKSLHWAQRGHDFAATRTAVAAAKAHGLHVAGHLIFGFPTETEEEILHSAEAINELELNAIKIHHLHIVRDTDLAALYAKNPFPLFDETGWVKIVCSFLERLDPRIVIERIIGDARGDTLIAPLWRKSKLQIIREIEEEFRRRGTYQGSAFSPAS